MSSPSAAASSLSTSSISLSKSAGLRANSSKTMEASTAAGPLTRPRIVIPSRAMELVHSDSTSKRQELPATVVTPKDPSISESVSPSSSRHAAPGAEKVGRWSDHEHKVFLEGLNQHGKQWKVIAGMIGTRTVVQVRTHAQKYFQRVDRHSAPPSVKPKSPVKRKMSLPASMPSRKKSKLSSPKRATVPRAASLSLVPNTTLSPVPTIAPPSTTSNLGHTSTALSHYPSYVSNSSSSDMSNWSATISPATSDEDVIEQLNIYDGYYCGPGEHQQSIAANQENDAVEEYDLKELGQDPLEWLIEAEPSFLPESSLPVFPDLSSTLPPETATPTTTITTNLQPIVNPLPGLVEATTSEEEGDFTDTEELASALDNMVDPTVTVQSLFLLPDHHL